MENNSENDILAISLMGQWVHMAIFHSIQCTLYTIFLRDLTSHFELCYLLINYDIK